jgi:hypothetical protein
MSQKRHLFWDGESKPNIFRKPWSYHACSQIRTQIAHPQKITLIIPNTEKKQQVIERAPTD